MRIISKTHSKRVLLSSNIVADSFVPVHGRGYLKHLSRESRVTTRTNRIVRNALLIQGRRQTSVECFSIFFLLYTCASELGNEIRQGRKHSKIRPMSGSLPNSFAGDLGPLAMNINQEKCHSHTFFCF